MKSHLVFQCHVSHNPYTISTMKPFFLIAKKFIRKREKYKEYLTHNSKKSMSTQAIKENKHRINN